MSFNQSTSPRISTTIDTTKFLPNLPKFSITSTSKNPQTPSFYPDTPANNNRKTPFTSDSNASIQAAWSNYTKMTDAERNLMLKGLVNRSSTVQIEYICTLLNLKGTETELNGKTFSLYPKEYAARTRSPVKSQPFLGTTTTATSQDSIKIDYKQSWLEHKVNFNKAISQKLNKNFKEFLVGGGIQEDCLLDYFFPDPDQKHNHHQNHQQPTSTSDPMINSNLYTKLLNSNFDIKNLKQQMKLSKPELTKRFTDFLIESCTKLQLVMKSIQQVSSQETNEDAITKIRDSIAEAISAKFITIYLLEESTHDFIVKSSNWQPRYRRLGLESVICGTDVGGGKKEARNLYNMKSMEEYSVKFEEVYGLLDCECLLSIPIFQGASRVVGLLEIINKKSGSPFFNAEDEFIAKTFSGVFTLILNNLFLFGDNTQTPPTTPPTEDPGIEILIRKVIYGARDLTGAERCSVFLIDKNRKELYSVVASDTTEIRMSMSLGIAGFVSRTGETVHIRNSYNSTDFNHTFDDKNAFVTRAMICVPLKNSKNEIIGVAQIINKVAGDQVFKKEDLVIMNVFTTLVAAIVEKSLAIKSLQRKLTKTIQEKEITNKIVQATTSILIGLDGHGKLIKINHPSLLSIKKNEKDCFDQFLGPYPRNADLIEDIKLAYRTTKNISVFNYTFTYPDGKTTKNIDYSISQILSNEGSLVAEANANKEPDDKQFFVNSLVIHIQEVSGRHMLANSLARYMGHENVEKVINDSDALSGVSKIASVVNISIEGFGRDSDTGTKALAQLNNYYSYLLSSVKEENGMIHKFIGYSAQAVFGVPYPTPDDAIRSVNAAVRIRNLLSSYNNQSETPITISIGICRGSVFSGNAGPPERTEYTVLGGPCKIAQELEATSRMFGVQIVVDETTRELVKHNFHLREIDLVNIKGIAKPVTVYEVLGPSENELDRDTTTTLICYALGLAEYRQQNWLMAISHFRKARVLTGDEPSKFFISRCKNIVEGKFDVPKAAWDQTCSVNN